jgi:hypothetical protein
MALLTGPASWQRDITTGYARPRPQRVHARRPRQTAVRDRSSSHGRLRRRVSAALAAPAPPGRRGPARRSLLVSSLVLPGGSGKVGSDDIGGVPVETAAGAVVAHRRARIGVRRGFLHVAERNPGVERGGDECVPERVRRADHQFACGIAGLRLRPDLRSDRRDCAPRQGSSRSLSVRPARRLAPDSGRPCFPGE